MKISIISLSLVFGLFIGCNTKQQQPQLISKPVVKIPYNPEKYVSYQAASPIVVDGVLDDAAWQQAPWSNSFVDIEGELKPNPTWDTKVKMLWDDRYFYVAAELEEPHVWATLTEHDAVIFYDNDFEVFIDPDGDTHHYYEYEVNAFNTGWDLILTKPYRDNGQAVDSWEIPGLKSAVKIYGTLNNPKDQDQKWTVELAFPWEVLRECSQGQKLPVDGDQWRVNFSRVQWLTEIIDGKYVKKKDANGKNLPENNWVWSPQGVIAMHQPETWGFVQFSTKTQDADFVVDADDEVKWALRQLYYHQSTYRSENGFYASQGSVLRMEDIKVNNQDFRPEIMSYKDGYVASHPSLKTKGSWYIQNDGKIWFANK